MRIVLDENLPHLLLRNFGSEHEEISVQYLGLAGLANGELLKRLGGKHDVFLTADKNLRYQQNLSGRNLAIVELPTNRVKPLMAIIGEIQSTVVATRPGSYIQVEAP